MSELETKQERDPNLPEGMDLHDYYYDLPQELIAQDPLSDRAASRLMVLDKKTGAIEHRIFRDVIDYLNPGDVMVINDTRVIPARLIGVKEGTGASIEVLLLNRKKDMKDTWEVLVRPGKKCKAGTRIDFGEGRLKCEVKDIIDDGNRIVQFEYEGIFEEILDELGQMPLPPYIKHQLQDPSMYNTVYAKHDGSAAAPTAGLHFTEELLKEIEEKGIDIVRITLHVGLGTFRPVKTENILDHHMHTEWYQVTKDAADRINRARAAGGKIVAVGTTSTRTLETVTDENGIVHAGSGDTSIFIYPGYHYKAVDELITNFHLPESTLVMLVSALAGRENILHAYSIAVQEKYRFFSFGDAMLIK
jgi:S-adenosylmethionine:tRNA ribosyltransferase-isomerase